jgi:hypothetical protein
MWTRRVVAAVVLIAATVPAEADDEAPNIPYVKSDTWGRCYAKAVPEAIYGPTKGTTRVYEVTKDKDVLLHTYDWYRPEIHLQCNMVGGKGGQGLSMAQMGRWPSGSKASHQDDGITFWFSGKLLKRYSTLDLAGTPDNVSRSRSHYRIVDKVLGYRWITSNDYAFDVRLHDGRTLSFNPVTGARLPAPAKAK